MSLTDSQARYLEVLLKIAEENRPDPDIFNRIERLLELDVAQSATSTEEAKSATPDLVVEESTQEQVNRYVCPGCGGRKSWVSKHCRKCNTGRQPQSPKEEARSNEAEAQEARRIESKRMAEGIEEPARIPISDRVTIDTTRLPPWAKRDLAEGLKEKDGKKVREVASGAR